MLKYFKTSKFDIKKNRSDTWKTSEKTQFSLELVYIKKFVLPYDKNRYILKYIMK